MKRLIILLALTISCGFSSFSQINPSRQWSSYRGINGSGILDNANLPESFIPAMMTNVLWKIPTEGLGLSSPVIWGEKLFYTTAVSAMDADGLKPGLYGDVMPVNDNSVHEWKVICINKQTGKPIWEKVSYKGVPAMKRHPKSTHANTSIATDGKHVIAFFGSEGLYCYDINGNLVWKKNFGVLKSVFFSMENAEWEFASSPILHNGVVIVQVDVLENSFIAAFDAATGKELWKTERKDYPGWSTPSIYNNNGKTMIAVNGFNHMGGYDFTTGKEIWRMSGGGDIPIPMPIVSGKMIYLNGAHGKFSPIIAVSSDATGDITLAPNTTSNNYVKWSRPRGGSYMHSMLLYNNKLYNIDWNGTVTCINPLTGVNIYTAKLGKSKSFVASPVASDGKIYIVDEEGTVYIIDSGDTFKLISEIELKDNCLTAPAITDGIIFFRTQKYLWAVGSR